MTPSLTVAIPTYNRRESLSRLVQMIIPQLQPEDEFLVVDDGSQDGTAEAVNDLPRVRLVTHRTNQGMVKAWNTCLSEATREWICIVHNDDILLPNALTTIKRACALTERAGMIGHKKSWTVDDKFRCEISEPGPTAVLNSLMIPSGVTIHRSVLDALGGFDERFTYSTDIEYFARISSRFETAMILNPQILDYQLHGGNYQYATWRKPDFFQQLGDIEDLVMSYSGMGDAERAAWRRTRWTNYLIHMFRSAVRIKDKETMKRVGMMLWERPDAGRRLRTLGYMASTVGWCPRLSVMQH